MCETFSGGTTTALSMITIACRHIYLRFMRDWQHYEANECLEDMSVHLTTLYARLAIL